MENLKTHLINYCNNYLQQKVNTLKLALQEVTDAGNNETKSTAGDKHETGRAMMQLEQEKLGNQLIEIEKQFNDFNKIDFSTSSQHIVLGSLVTTNKGLFFITTSIGKIELQNTTVFVVSIKSPIGMAFAGKPKNATIAVNATTYQILNVN